MTLPTGDFDPWEATWEEALAHESPLSISRFGGTLEVSALRARIENGDGRAVLEAVACCAVHDLVMPKWLADAYVDRFRRVATFQAASWDQAFGKPHPKGTHLAKKAKYLQFRWPLMQAAIALLAEDPSRDVDKALFEDVAAALGNQPGLMGTVCMEIYQAAVKDLHMNPAKIRKLAVRRKRA